MPRIKRKPIHPHGAIVAVQFPEFFTAFVAVRAQALQLPQPEFIHVAMVRVNVIANACCGHSAFTQAPFAQWLNAELMPGHPFPSLGVVQTH
jgi:hypothetical protein